MNGSNAASKNKSDDIISINRLAYENLKKEFEEIEKELENNIKKNKDIEISNETLQDMLKQCNDELKSVKEAYTIELSQVREAFKNSESEKIKFEEKYETMHKLYKTYVKDSDLDDIEKENVTPDIIIEDDVVSMTETELSNEEEWIEAKRRRGRNRRQGKPVNNVENRDNSGDTSRNINKACNGGQKCPDTDLRPLNNSSNNRNRVSEHDKKTNTTLKSSGLKKKIDKPCHLWNNNGFCTFGENCMFQHIASDYCRNDGKCTVRMCSFYHEKQSFLYKNQMNNILPSGPPQMFYPPNFYQPRSWPPMGRWANQRMF